MNELREIVRALDSSETGARLVAGDGRAVLATLVRLRGSGYRRPGARMVVRPDGGWAGFVSGGCLEADVAERAAEVAGGGPPIVLTYDTRGGDDDVWGLAMGCNGVIEVLLESLPATADPGHPAHLLSRMRARRPGAVAVVIERDPDAEAAVGDRAWFEPDGATATTWAEPLREAAIAAIVDGRPAWATLGSRDGERSTVFVEPILPPLRLLVAGAGPDATPVVQLAHGLGWDVVVVDPRPAFADARRFSGLDDVTVLRCAPSEVVASVGIDDRTAVVVMTHHFGRDRELLRALLPTAAAYVGVLGPRRRTESLLDRLAGEDGFRPSADIRAKLHGPVGLDLGAATPAEIGLAMVAEIRAVLSGRTGGPLRDRSGPIYDRESA